MNYSGSVKKTRVRAYNIIIIYYIVPNYEQIIKTDRIKLYRILNRKYSTNL